MSFRSEQWLRLANYHLNLFDTVVLARRLQIPLADPRLILNLASKRRDDRYSRGYDARDRDHGCGYDCARGSAQLDADVEGLG